MESKNSVKNQKRRKSPSNIKSNKKQHKSTQKEEIENNQIKKTSSNDKLSKSEEYFCFKNPKYRETGYAKKTKVWKNLKQIMALQKSQSSEDSVLYASIDAPPSTKPPKKYSDISGFPALYVDPTTKLRYSNADEYTQIQHLDSDSVIGLLALRRAAY